MLRVFVRSPTGSPQEPGEDPYNTKRQYQKTG
jgi:hypothetical protein